MHSVHSAFVRDTINCNSIIYVYCKSSHFLMSVLLNILILMLEIFPSHCFIMVFGATFFFMLLLLNSGNSSVATRKEGQLV